MVDYATIANIINQYLYGQLETPAEPVDRLRHVDPGDDPRTELTVDAVSYMASVGRFANLADAKIVRDFFGGSLQRQGVTDSNGVTRLKVSDLSAELFDKAKFSISQYSAGVSDQDFLERAMIWGSTSYVLGGGTTFVWDSSGNLSIENGCILPYNDNFDFKTAGGNPIIQQINNTILKPRIDPYGIGQRVDLIFDTASKNQLQVNASGNVYTQAEYNAFGLPSYVFDTVDDILNFGNFGAYAAAAVNLFDAIDKSGAANYTYDGKDVIFGTSFADELSYSSHQGLPTTSDPTANGAYFVGGDGDDTIRGGEGLNDIIYGGNASGIDDGVDTVDYSRFEKPVSVDFDGSSAVPAITVTDQKGGIDVLHSIEKIIGTKGDDTFSFKGVIPLECRLEIDSGGGGHDKIDLSQYQDTSGLKLNITNSNAGDGYIQSRGGGGGKILIYNFHTDIVGSDYSDIITDDSYDTHSISGGGGDDNITVSGSGATIDGGGGNDVIHLKSSAATIQFGVGGGHDVVEFDGNDGDYNLALQNLNSDDVEIIAGGRYIYGSGIWEPGNPNSDGYHIQFIAVRIRATGETITFLENGQNVGPRGATYDEVPGSRKLDSISLADGTVITQSDLWNAIGGAPEGSINGVEFNFDGWGYKKDYPHYGPFMHSSEGYLDYVNATYLQAAPFGYPPPAIDKNFGGTPGSDNIYPGAGNDTVSGGAGSDTVRESPGDDTYIWNSGDGDDTIEGSDASDGFNTLQLGPGITLADLQFSVINDGAGLTLSFANQAGSISLNDELVGEEYGVDRILFADGTIMTRAELIAAASSTIIGARTTIVGTAGADYISAPRGNFVISGENGNDTIVVKGSGAGTFRFSSADGHDKIDDFGLGYSRADILELTDVNPVEVTLTRAGDALLVTLTTTGATINVAKQFEDDDGNIHGINAISFADGTVWTRSQIDNLILASTGDASPTAEAVAANAVQDAAMVRGTLVATDPDQGDTLKFKLDNQIAGLVVATNGEWSFDPSNPAYRYLGRGQQLTVTANYHVTDSAGATSSSTLTLTVTGANDMPIVLQDFVNPRLANGEELALDVASHFVDPDGDPLSFSAKLADGSPLPSWLTFDNGQLTGVVPSGAAGPVDIMVAAFDGEFTTHHGFRLRLGPNRTPIAQALPDVSGGVNSPLDVTIPGGAFADPDGDSLTLSATLSDGTALPGWLSFNNGHLTGIPPITAFGDVYDVKVTASDGEKEVNSNFFLSIGRQQIIGTSGDDTLMLDTLFNVTGGLGNDFYIVSGDGGGVFNYSVGDGLDVLVQFDGGARSDQLVFSNISSDGVSVARYGDAADFVVDENDDFWVSNQFSGDNPGGAQQGLDLVQFADGVSWDRNEIRNRVEASEILVDGSNPCLVGSQDVEAFAIQSGIGATVIDNFSAIGSNHDYLQFDRSQFSDWAHLLGATVQQGSDLVITLDASDSVRLTGVSMSAFTTLDVRFVSSVPA